MIFVDSSVIVAQFLDTDPNHIKASKAWSNITIEKSISEDILNETLTIISQRKGRLAAAIAYPKLVTEHTVFPVTTERFDAGLKLFLDPKLQKDIPLIDCISTAICHEMKIKRILTFGSHFRSLGLIPIS